VVVLVKNFQVQDLGAGLGGDGVGNHQPVGARKGRGGAIDDRSAIQTERPPTNQRLDPCSGKVGGGIGEGAVDSARGSVRQFDDSSFDGLTYLCRSLDATRKWKVEIS
jgi:hypothetical protein